MFTHYLLLNPLFQSKRQIKFHQMVNPVVTFNPWYFFFSIFWIIKNKLWGMIPFWIFSTIFSGNIYSYFLENPPFNYTYSNPSFLIFLTTITFLPHFLTSFFVDKILSEKNKNIIWKYRNNPSKQEHKISSFNTVWFSLISLLIFLSIAQIGLRYEPNSSAISNDKSQKIIQNLDFELYK